MENAWRRRGASEPASEVRRRRACPLRRRGAAALVVVGLLLATVACTGNSTSPGATASPSASGPEQKQVAAIAAEAMTKYHLRALILRVTTDDKDTYTGALGDSMTGVPATTDMLVRNGFVAYSYLTTMLLKFVDQKKISLDDKLSKYLPQLPDANAVTIGMLAYSTSGYADYVYQPEVLDNVELHPERQWTTAELIKIGTSAPRLFAPGTNFAYSHTNYAILGEVLAKVGGKSLGALMKQYIFEPMGLKHTQVVTTPQIPGPALHTFSSERRVVLKIPDSIPFYEDSTFWNPSWSAPEGAVQTSDVADLTTSIQAIGSGTLLSAASHQAQVGPHLVGFGHAQKGCPACRPNTATQSFGMGVIRDGQWITGNKFYAGSGAIVGYLPSKKIAIAVITTYRPDAFNSDGEVTDAGRAIMASVAAALAPGSPLSS